VKPDCDHRPDSLDQPVGSSCLGFGEGVRTGVLGVAEDSEWPPMPGEVAIEIDAAGVLPRACRRSVWVQVGNDPERCGGRWRRRGQVAGDSDARRLVAMDASHDEDGSLGMASAEVDRVDGAAVYGVADDESPRSKRGGRTGKRAIAGRFTRWVVGSSSANTAAVTELVSESAIVRATSHRRLRRAGLMFLSPDEAPKSGNAPGAALGRGGASVGP